MSIIHLEKYNQARIPRCNTRTRRRRRALADRGLKDDQRRALLGPLLCPGRTLDTTLAPACSLIELGPCVRALLADELDVDAVICVLVARG